MTFARFQPALQNQNKFLNFAFETNRDRRLVLYTCLSPPIVSGKAFLSCTTYLLKVCATFLVKLVHITCFHAKSKAFAYRLYFFKQQLLTRPDLWRPLPFIKPSDHKWSSFCGYGLSFGFYEALKFSTEIYIWRGLCFISLVLNLPVYNFIPFCVLYQSNILS